MSVAIVLLACNPAYLVEAVDRVTRVVVILEALIIGKYCMHGEVSPEDVHGNQTLTLCIVVAVFNVYCLLVLLLVAVLEPIVCK